MIKKTLLNYYNKTPKIKSKKKNLYFKVFKAKPQKLLERGFHHTHKHTHMRKHCIFYCILLFKVFVVRLGLNSYTGEST